MGNPPHRAKSPDGESFRGALPDRLAPTRVVGFLFLVWMGPAALHTLNGKSFWARGEKANLTRDWMASGTTAVQGATRRARVTAGNGFVAETMLVFVVPVYNEAENLPRLLSDFEGRPELFSSGGRLVLVDDGSTDGTPDLVREYHGRVPVELVQLERNQGPGVAFRTGFEAVLADCADNSLVVTLEGDTTSDLNALPQMLQRAAEGADLVVADWRMVNVSRVRRLLSRSAGFVVRRALGLQAKTVSSFFRVYRASALRHGFDRYGDEFMRETGFACKAEILVKLTALGVRVEEVPVPLDWSRRLGKSKMPVLRTMLAYWRMLLRLRLAGAPS
jgi:dolichol-phosphate mannosyltransferase